MALQFVDTDGTLVIPQAVAKWQTAPSNAGIATRGVIVLVGEADMGPSYAEEPADSVTGVALGGATWGPGQFAQVQQKYGSGPLVDAFRVAANPSRDPAVRGAPTQIITIKTNTGTKAQAALSGGYGVLQAKQAGSLGNLIYLQVTSAVAEVPASLSLGYIYKTAAETVNVSVNGRSPYTLVVTDTNPAAFKATNLAGLAAVNVTLSGGTIYQPAGGLVAVTAAVAVAGNVITVTLTGGVWATQPQVGQVLIIANTSSITGAANANSGYYIVNSATPSGLVATKQINLDGATLTAPVAVAPGATADGGMMDAYTVLVFTNTIAAAAGTGKSLTFHRSAGPGSHFVNGTTVVTASLFATSSVEAAVNVLVNRQADNIAESFRVGGNVVLSVGVVGTALGPSITIGATTITLDDDVNPVTIFNKADFKTIGDLVAYINSKVGWLAATSPAFQSLSPSVIDLGLFYCAQNGMANTMPARIKNDAYATSQAIATSRAVEFVVNPTSGTPAVQAVTFLAGGVKGGTTDTAFAAAVATAGLTRCNFVVPLFSRDATADIVDGLTDPSSTYTIDGINGYAAAHVLQFSQFKKRRPRQAFVSKRDTFSSVKTAAQTIASYRVWMSFLDVSTIGSNGVQWFQPWMGSVLAAGMQAAGFYRPIFNKSIAASGVRQFAGDFSTQDDDAVEQALLAGLGVIRARDGGGFGFVSDQTTYQTDDNFVLNSVQAVYVADVISQTVAQRMERAFVGQSFADVTASAALSFLKGIMADLKRLKLIASSDDAVDGYKDAKIEIRPPAMLVSAEVKEATGLYFIPIKFLITQVQQTASQG